MVNQPPDTTAQVARTTADEQIAELRAALRLLQTEQERLLRQRRRHLLIIGLVVSLSAHAVLLIYLGFLYRVGPPGPGAQPVAFEFALAVDEELTDMDEFEVEELEPAASELEMPMEELSADLMADISMPDLQISEAAAVPTLGGSGTGSGDEPGLSGGAAGTSFFGVSSKGTRFAFIVDRSASMQDDSRMEAALRELARSIDELPDYTYFFVLFFSSEVYAPPMQRGWMKATASKVRSFIRWLDEVHAVGGTEPRNAFMQVFALEVRPDVLFFLTDGVIEDFTADEVAQMNARGKRIVINTIAFGDPSSQDLLRELAYQSGGVYRFVPSGGGR